MKWLNDYRMRLILVGFVAAIVLGGGIANADFTFGEPTQRIWGRRSTLRMGTGMGASLPMACHAILMTCPSTLRPAGTVAATCG
ncbi:MAG: hypothetical protein ACYSUD_16775 [Planctomycetota bacterium]|jgi:hypothetical protein